jgi:hypothetical protein
MQAMRLPAGLGDQWERGRQPTPTPIGLGLSHLDPVTPHGELAHLSKRFARRLCLDTTWERGWLLSSRTVSIALRVDLGDRGVIYRRLWFRWQLPVVLGISHSLHSPIPLVQASKTRRYLPASLAASLCHKQELPSRIYDWLAGREVEKSVQLVVAVELATLQVRRQRGERVEIGSWRQRLGRKMGGARGH